MNRDENALRLDTATSRHPKLTIRVLLYHNSEKMWIAQGLERSMVAHGPTPESAMLAIHKVLQLRVNFDSLHNRLPLSQLEPAAKMYWDASRHAVRVDDICDAESMRPAELEFLRCDEPLCATA